MRKNALYILIIIILFSLFYLLFKGLQKPNFYSPSKIINNQIINFTSRDLFTGENIEFKNLLIDKKFTLLNIWSSWCLPCREEHKFLIKLSNQNNLNVIGLNYKDKEMNAKKFLKEFKNPFSKILIDADGIHSIELGAYGVPETFIINNKEKKVYKKFIGPLNKESYKEILDFIK